jgi:hypothetical protein
VSRLVDVAWLAILFMVARKLLLVEPQVADLG